MELKGNKTYGRRRGKRLRPAQQALLKDVLPRVAVDPSKFVIADPKLRQEYLAQGRDAIWLEIGFGGGEHLLNEAVRNPQTSYIGFEPFQNGVVKLLAGIKSNSLTNILVYSGDVLDCLAKIPDQSISGIYLLYPDPWPKSRQKKRRIINAANVEQFARILRTGGELRFASDIDDYCAWTLRHFLHSSFFDWEAEQPSEWLEPWPDWPGTRYEKKAIAAGRCPTYLTFVKKEKLQTSD